mgnify:CR=1 FL=1
MLEWTNQRWIISFSKDKGDLTIKDKAKNEKIELIKNLKKSELYKTVLEYFPDADLIDVKLLGKDEKNEWFFKNIRERKGIRI